MTFTFDGFEPANTTPVPDILFDVLLPHLNEAQLKVMLYIIRRTLGFKKTEDAISLKQFRWGIITKEKKQLDSGCGLKNFTTISKALKALEALNCIERETAKTADGDDATTVYKVRFRGTTANVVPTTDSVVPSYAKRSTRTTPDGVGVLRQTESQLNSNTRNSLQETVIQESTLDACASTRKQPINFEEKSKRITDSKLKAVKGHNDDTTLTQPLLDQPTRSPVSDSVYAGRDTTGLHDIEHSGQLARPQAVQVDSSHSHDEYTKEELDDVPTEKLQAMPKGQADASVDHRDLPRSSDVDTAGVPDVQRAERAREAEALEALGLAQKPGAGTRLSPADTPPGVGTGDATSRQAPSSNAGTPARQAGAVLDTSVSAGAAQAIPKRPPRRKPLVMPDVDVPQPKSDTREIQRRINEHRGYVLEERGQIIQERIAVKTWCNLHEEGEYDIVMHRLRKDPYWGKDENYYRIGGVALLKETPKALAKRSDKESKRDPDDTVISFDDYVGNGPEAREAILLEYEEHRKNGTLAW